MTDSMYPSAGSQPQTESEIRRNWFAVNTRSRHERTVERFLNTNGLATYLPTQTVWSRRTDRRKRITVPALPGYLFLNCAMTPEVRALVKKAPGVVCLVSVDGQPCRIPNSQIESLQVILSADVAITENPAYVVGQEVRVVAGPLKGASGVLNRVDPDQSRLVVRIDHVGYSLSVVIHEADVEVVSG